MDLFQNTALVDKLSKIDIAATKLAILFSEEIDIPKQYRKGLKKPSKSKEDTLLIKNFKSNVANWKDLIKIMIDKVEPETAWRFINLTPKFGDSEENAVYNEDFLAFTDYLIARRDKENCNFDEIGRLSQLHTAFQKTIENGR
ncbi:MAG TPA: hypothetical protein PKE03_09560 [Bacteroidales bacterium]|nr:hypothetical protein [Bacteroidales bacterium]